MPRDGSGIYTLPAGNPVVTNTLIESNWANPTMSDIAVQLNNVLTRDGLLGPVNPFKLVDGAVATPGLSFNSEPGLGLYRRGTSQLSFAASNALVADLDASATDSTLFRTYPRTALGTAPTPKSGFGFSNLPFTAANRSEGQLSANQSCLELGSIGVGAGPVLPFKLTAPIENDGQIVLAHEQYTLVRVSSSILRLLPYKGNKITIADANYRIPNAGVDLAAGGLAINTDLNVYVSVLTPATALVPAVLQLEANTTAHSQDATTGMEIKTGDRTRTLVGKVRLTTGPVFVDSLTQRFVLPWANRRPVTLNAPLTSSVGYSSSTTGEVTSALRCEFLVWAGGSIQSTINGKLTHSLSAVADSWIGFDGVQVDSFNGISIASGSAALLALTLTVAPTEGYHSTTLLSDNPGGAGSITYIGGATASTGRIANQVLVLG